MDWSLLSFICLGVSSIRFNLRSNLLLFIFLLCLLGLRLKLWRSWRRYVWCKSLTHKNLVDSTGKHTSIEVLRRRPLPQLQINRPINLVFLVLVDLCLHCIPVSVCHQTICLFKNFIHQIPDLRAANHRRFVKRSCFGHFNISCWTVAHNISFLCLKELQC